VVRSTLTGCPGGCGDRRGSKKITSCAYCWSLPVKWRSGHRRRAVTARGERGPIWRMPNELSERSTGLLPSFTKKSGIPAREPSDGHPLAQVNNMRRLGRAAICLLQLVDLSRQPRRVIESSPRPRDAKRQKTACGWSSIRRKVSEGSGPSARATRSAA